MWRTLDGSLCGNPKSLLRLLHLVQNLSQPRHSPKYAAFRLDRFYRTLSQLRLCSLRAIPHQQAIKAPVTCLTHRAAHTNIRRYTRDDYVPHALDPQDKLKVGMRKSALPRLVYYGFPITGGKFGNDFVAEFAADEKTAEGPCISYTGTCGVVAGAESFARGERGQVKAVAWDL